MNSDEDWISALFYLKPEYLNSSRKFFYYRSQMGHKNIKWEHRNNVAEKET